MITEFNKLIICKTLYSFAHGMNNKLSSIIMIEELLSEIKSVQWTVRKHIWISNYTWWTFKNNIIIHVLFGSWDLCDLVLRNIILINSSFKTLQEILSGPCFSTSCSMRCTDLSSGSSYCGPVISGMYEL